MFVWLAVIEKKFVKDEWGQNRKLSPIFRILFYYGKTILAAEFGHNTKVVELDLGFQEKLRKVF